MKILSIIYTDMESLIEKMNYEWIDEFQSNPENSSLTKINNDVASGYSLLTNRSFHVTKTSSIIQKRNDILYMQRRI